MAGRLRSAMLYLGLVDDEDRDDYYDDVDLVGDDGYGDEPVAAPVPVRQPAHTADSPARRVPVAATAPAAASYRNAPAAVEPYRITTLTPRTYNEARTIGEHFREGVPVIINLTEMDDADAKRLVDFAAGLIFGLHGSIERVTNKVFLLSPSNVEVSAEDKARMAQSGFFNQS
jgi:cell division inhibitor SepF